MRITEAKPTISITNVNGLKYFFRLPSTYSRATIPGRTAKCRTSENIPLSAWVNAWIRSCQIWLKFRRCVSAFCPHFGQKSTSGSSAAPQFKQLVECISRFGFGENNKILHLPCFRFGILRPTGANNSDFAFPQIQMGLVVVTLFPLPLRPEIKRIKTCPDN